MKRGVLWKLSVAATNESEEALGELLGRNFGQPVSTHTDFRTGCMAASVYLKSKPTARLLAALRSGIAELRGVGLKVGPGRIRLQKIRRENWAESWKRHFKPLDIAGRLLVRPSWIRRKPKRNQAVVILDPGLSFGTGQHPTTSFCLHELVRVRRPGQRLAFLDIGTGSGILAIAAAKLGYAPVQAFDFDPESIRVARANANRNGVLKILKLLRVDLTRLPVAPARRYDVICANLVSTLLLAERERILARLEPGGSLVLAGILKSEFAQVRDFYSAAGLCLTKSRLEKEWCSGSFLYGEKNIE